MELSEQDSERALFDRHQGAQFHQVSRSEICRLGKAFWKRRRRRPLGESGVFSSADPKSKRVKNNLAGGQSSQGGEGEPPLGSLS